MNTTTTRKPHFKNKSRTDAWQGMNWLRQEKRLAIYLRDGMACAYCGCGVEDGKRLSVDHVVAVELGGKNTETNLVTACMECNKSKGDRSLVEFAGAVAGYVNHGVNGGDIVANVKRLLVVSLVPFKAEAKALIERRGSVAKVIASL